jgi:hypothetical protein
MSDFFDLPEMVLDLVNARDRLVAYYRGSGRTFTFDGKLVGDLGEAIAAELFGIELAPQQAFDGRARDGRTVQVKASTTGAGPAFRKQETGADHLLHFLLDLPKRRGEVAFNGPEHIALACMPATWTQGQRAIPLGKLRAANASVPPEARLIIQKLDIWAE